MLRLPCVLFTRIHTYVYSQCASYNRLHSAHTRIERERERERSSDKCVGKQKETRSISSLRTAWTRYRTWTIPCYATDWRPATLARSVNYRLLRRLMYVRMYGYRVACIHRVQGVWPGHNVWPPRKVTFVWGVGSGEGAHLDGASEQNGLRPSGGSPRAATAICATIPKR